MVSNVQERLETMPYTEASPASAVNSSSDQVSAAAAEASGAVGSGNSSAEASAAAAASQAGRGRQQGGAVSAQASSCAAPGQGNGNCRQNRRVEQHSSGQQRSSQCIGQVPLTGWLGWQPLDLTAGDTDIQAILNQCAGLIYQLQSPFTGTLESRTERDG